MSEKPKRPNIPPSKPNPKSPSDRGAKGNKLPTFRNPPPPPPPKKKD